MAPKGRGNKIVAEASALKNYAVFFSDISTEETKDMHCTLPLRVVKLTINVLWYTVSTVLLISIHTAVYSINCASNEYYAIKTRLWAISDCIIARYLGSFL